MSMTKKEQAELEAAHTEAALRWPTEKEPAPLTPDWLKHNSYEIPCRDTSVYASHRGWIGWDFDAYSRRVEEVWSDGSWHGSVADGKILNTSQRAGRVYATQREARLAMRWALCRQYAYYLRFLDKQMEAAE